MAQQIIITKDNYGIDLSCVFLDSKKKPIDITGMNVEVVITNPNDVIIDTIQATIINPIVGYSSIVINKEHTNILGLYKTFWTLLDSDGRVTAQEDVYYYVKDKNGGVTSEDENLGIDADSFIDKVKDIENNIDFIEETIEGIKKINVNAEVYEARGEYTKLSDRLNNTDLSISNINEQLETKANITEVVKKGQVDLDEMTERTLKAIQGGEGANFNLLSIPRDFSVNYAKTNFLEVGVNKMKPISNIQSGIDVTIINNKISVYGTATKSDFIKIGEVDKLIKTEYTLYKKDVENPSGSNVMYLRGTNSLGEVVNIVELPKSSESVTFTVTENYTDVHLTFYASNTKPYVFKCFIQLNFGNSIAPYENYEETLKNSNYIKEGYLLNNYNLETPFLISNLGGNIITYNNGIIEVDNKLNYLFLITKKGDYIDISAIKGKNVNITEKTGLHFIYTDKINIYSYAYNQLPENKKDLYFLGSFYYNSTHKIVLSVNLNCKYSLNKNIINFIGDSLTYGYLDGNTRMKLPYPALVENNLGCICNNYGISGTRISQTQDNAMSNDNRINSWDKSATCNVIKGGTNDYLGGVSIGTLDDYKNGIYTTFLGGYEYLINKLYEKFPSKPILLITPPQTWSLKVVNGQTLLQFVNAIIQLGEKYSLPVLDLYRNGQYCKASMKQVGANGKYILTTDGVHYTQHYVSNILTPIISDFIKRNINI